MAGAVSIAVLDLFTEVLGILGVYDPGEDVNPNHITSLLFTVNGIVDGWGAEALTISGDTVLKTFATAAGKAAYTLGPDAGNDFVTAVLPNEITGAGGMIGTREDPIDLYTDAQWRAVGLKSLSGSVLGAAWIQYGAAAHTLNFNPVPSAAIPLVLYVRQALQRFTSSTNTLSLAPGYQEALTYELAIKASPKFGALATVPDWLPQAWAMAKTRIKESNFEAIDAACDPAVVTPGRWSGGGSLDFYRGK